MLNRKQTQESKVHQYALGSGCFGARINRFGNEQVANKTDQVKEYNKERQITNDTIEK